LEFVSWYVVLVGIAGQYYHGSPWAVIVFNEPVAFEGFDKSVDDHSFVWTVSGCGAADGWAGASVNLEGEASDGPADSFLAEDVPVLFDNVNDEWDEVLWAVAWL